MSDSITSRASQQLGYFNALTSNRVVVRVKFVDSQTDYDAATTVAVDTDLRADLSDKTVAELKNLCTASENFQFAERREIYRYAGGTTIDTLTIPLAKVNKTTIVGGFGLITEGAGGTQSFSVGIPGNNDFILGATEGTALAIPAGSTNALWMQTTPYATATPDASSIGDGVVYYAHDRVLAPGTPINLYITAGTDSTIGTGDFTFEFIATAMGQETLGITDGNNNKASTSGGPGIMNGLDRGPIYPLF